MTRSHLGILALPLASLAACTGDGLGTDSFGQLHTSPVRLYAADTDTYWESPWGYFAHGNVEVEVDNLAYDKSVEVHVRAGNRPWRDVAMFYLRTTSDGTEIWAAGIGLLSYAGDDGHVDVQMAMRYRTNGATYWDNNFGRDYWMSAGVRPFAGSHPSFVLGSSRQVKLEYASLTRLSAALVFDGEVIVRDLAYDKRVTLVYSTDGWATIGTAPLRYDRTVAGGDQAWVVSAEVWRGQHDDRAPPELDFAIAYEVDGVTYWDNRDTFDYRLSPGDEYRAGSDAHYPRLDQAPDAPPLPRQ